MIDAKKLDKKTQGYFATVPPQEILPIIDNNFQSTVRGLYVIGDVTGIPLVKIAANHGVDVIEKMETAGEFNASQTDQNGPLDLLIIGAGPAGLSAALEAQKRNLRYAVLERSEAANTVRGFPPGKKVYAEPRQLKNRSELSIEGDKEKTAFIKMVEQIIDKNKLNLKEGVEVKRILKKGDHSFSVDTNNGKSFPARNVIIAVGRQGEARKLNVPGEEKSDKVVYRLHSPDDYHQKELLIVGGGNSAIEAALMLMDTNRVTISYRREEFFRLKQDNRDLLEQAISQQKLTVLFQSEVQRIENSAVELKIQEKTETIHNDYVLVLIGTNPPIDFLLDTGMELDGIWKPKRVLFCLIGILLAYWVYFQSKYFALLPDAGEHFIPGFQWLFSFVHPRYANLYSMYYLVYFVAILGFGLYWGFRYKHRLIWRRNLSSIFFNWTLWWGLPTLLVSIWGRNPWTPLLTRSLNAWPLNMTAFDLDPIAQPGEPAWWTIVAIVGVVWAVVLTFLVLPIFTLLVGKHYCSHICSCGALAETLGSSYRHRSPKGDATRWAERFGYVFIPLAVFATLFHLMGYESPLGYYNTVVGTFLSGAIAIGVYPFLGQRIWCRFWCPLAFWMNFWGRWSRFKISAEPGKCIDCNVCNQYCQMGIDIKSRALQGLPVTLKDSPCVACAECIVRCPMEILHFGDLPAEKLNPANRELDQSGILLPILNSLDIPRVNDISMKDRRKKM